jgi:single-strand DNA-binding protein
MSSFNKVILMGNLTRDPELRYTQSNIAICKFGLAVNRRIKDQNGEWREEPTFVDITIFGKRGEAFAKFHTKGKPAFIEGSLRFDQWEDKEGGGKRSKLYVVGDTWEFVGGGAPGGGPGGGGGGGYEARGGNQQQQPEQQQQQQQQQQPQQPQGNYNREPQGGYGQQPSPEYLEVDDTPF